ncbi:MAG: transglycosylase family protein [Acidimicrobiales bacterium]
MRIRLALVAAVAACIVLLTAAVASAVSLAGGSPLAKGVRALGHEGKGASGNTLGASRAVVLLHLSKEFAWNAPKPKASLTAPPPAPPPAPPAPPAAPVPVPAPPPPQPVVTAASFTDATSTATRDWACIRDHESGDDYAEDTGNGYSGAYQFLPSTWNESVSGAGYSSYANGEAFEAPPAVQDAAALWLYDHDGWSPWSTRYVCGL